MPAGTDSFCPGPISGTMLDFQQTLKLRHDFKS
jgi:hypothetical protein